VGISMSDVQGQAAFAKAEGLTFPLLSDPDASGARKFGVLAKSGKWSRRVTFIIDGGGRIADVITKLDVRTHGEEIAKRLIELKKARGK